MARGSACKVADARSDAKYQDWTGFPPLICPKSHGQVLSRLCCFLSSVLLLVIIAWLFAWWKGLLAPDSLWLQMFWSFRRSCCRRCDPLFYSCLGVAMASHDWSKSLDKEWRFNEYCGFCIRAIWSAVLIGLCCANRVLVAGMSRYKLLWSMRLTGLLKNNLIVSLASWLEGFSQVFWKGILHRISQLDQEWSEKCELLSCLRQCMPTAVLMLQSLEKIGYGATTGFAVCVELSQPWSASISPYLKVASLIWWISIDGPPRWRSHRVWHSGVV